MPLPLPHTFVFDGRRVRYDVMGEGDPLVLIHGTPFSSQVWRRIAPIMSRYRRVHYFDLLGYGLSEQRAGEDVSLGIQNKLLAALIEHWRLSKPDIVAHDFGGATALRAALINRCEYRSLMLIDPVAVRPWGSPFVRHVLENDRAFSGVPAYIHEAMVNAYLQGATKRKLPADIVDIYASPWMGRVGQAAFYQQIAQMDQRYTDEVQPRYHEIDCPVSILWGEDDQWIPIERGVELADLIKGSRFTRVPDSGHLMQEDAPEAIIAELMDFLELNSAAVS